MKLERKYMDMMNTKTAEESYEFLNALLDDYSACKTELARTGIFRAFKLLLNKINEDHLAQISKVESLEKELEETKAKLPKTKEEITRILHEAGFHELEEVEGGVGHPCIPSPDMTPKEYAELYRRLYGEMTKADEKKLDREIKKIEEDEVKLEDSAVCSEKISENEEKTESKDNEDDLKDPVPEEVMLTGKDLDMEKPEEQKCSKTKVKKARTKSKKKSSKNKI